MNQETNKTKKVRMRSFYTALLISLAMIGAACAYAFQATTVTLEDNLESLQEDLSSQAETEATDFSADSYNAYMQPEEESYDAVVGVKTDVPKETEPAEISTVTAAEMEPQGEFAHVLVKPLEGEVVQPFSNGELVKSETTGTWQTHNGADIAGEEGASVSAIDNGTVVDVTKDALWGICVTVDHGNGVVSRYCGLSASLAVKNGDTVESGQTLGTIGNTADMESKQDSHLHFEVLKNDIYVDPIAYLSE